MNEIKQEIASRKRSRFWAEILK